MKEIWERVLANSFLGIHKSKIICSAEDAKVFGERQYHTPLAPLPAVRDLTRDVIG